jgi:flagellar motor protein MotB
MNRNARYISKRVDDENPYWISFSDLMTGLLVIFILAAVSLIIELTDKSEKVDQSILELKKAEKDRNDVIQEIQEELSKKGIVVLVADNETVVRIPESTLSFGSGQDDLPNDDFVISQVREIGKTIYNTLVKGKRINSFDTIFIEGHTDSDNFWKRKGNWGLSSDRAISVWNAWNDAVDGQPMIAELQNEMGQKLFSVSGYAATRRVNTQELTDADKAQNRRIDIRFTVKKPTIESLQEIKKISTGVIDGI